MADITYRVVAHDGGWAYTLQGTFSEPFASRAQAVQAAHRAAFEARSPGEPTMIEYEDEAGKWHTEMSQPDDRPEADVIE